MDSRAVNPAADFELRPDLFGVQGRARGRDLATGDLVRVRHLAVLFRGEKIFGGGDSELNPVLRRVADTCLAIGA